MKKALNNIDLMLFALLRAVLQKKPCETELFQNVSDKQWEGCYRLACKQGVMALAWDGVLTLPTEFMPNKNLKLTWALSVERYEQKYLRYCKTVCELASFYAKHGIDMMQIKGVGYSTEYPNPMHREGGDIDIYTYALPDSKMTNEEANALADELMERQGIEVEFHSVKHSNFFYKSIPIENHKNFLNVDSYESAVFLNQLLFEKMNPIEKRLEGTDYPIKTPSVEFNAIFLTYHAAQHYGTGLSLHHLFDWAVLLKNHGWCLPEEVKDHGFLRFVYALTSLCNRYLGTEIAMNGDEKLMEKILQVMIYPKYESKISTDNKLGILWYKTKRFLYHYQLKQEILPSSLLGNVWKSFIAHIMNPETIFDCGEK